MCSSGLESLTFPFSTKFLRSKDLRFTTSPAIATYTLLPPVLPCLPWFIGLYVTTFFIVFCRAVGHFKNFFCFCVGFASSLTKLWLVRLWQCACKWCGHHFISFLLFSSFDFINSSFSLPYFVSYQSLVWSSSLSMVGFRCFISSSLVHK